VGQLVAEGLQELGGLTCPSSWVGLSQTILPVDTDRGVVTSLINLNFLPSSV